MKILFYRYGSLCEPDILECMQTSGHEIIEVTDEIDDKHVTFAKSVEIVSKRINETNCDCVFTVNFFPALSDLCNIYRIRYISWVVASPILELYTKAILNPYNRIFIFDRTQFDEISKFNPGCIFYYPLAVNITGKQKVIENATQEQIERFSCDVSFIGSLYTEKCPMDNVSPSPYLNGYLDAIINAQLKLYGIYLPDSLVTDEIAKEFKKCTKDFYKSELPSFITDKEIVSQYYLGGIITSKERKALIDIISKKFNMDIYTASDLSCFAANTKLNHKGLAQTLTEMPIIFNKSKINLNPTCRSIRSGIALRAFDIMGSEGFMLSNYQSELCELFTPGEDFVYYDSIEQVPELIDYYLNHENERREIAHNGYKKVCDEYDYLIRFNKLLLMAFSV